MPRAKKYTLFSSSEAGKDGKAPCAFFFSEKGCRNGDNCKFSHEKPESGSPPCVVAPSEVGSVVSSESGGDRDENPFLPAAATPKAMEETPSAGSKRKNRRATNSDPFAKKSKPSKATTQSPNPTQKQEDTVKKTPATKTKPSSAVEKESPRKSSSNVGVDFRSLNLPIADFNLPSASDHAKDAKVEEVDNNTLETPPVPKSHDLGKKWLPVVEATHKHKRFTIDFNYERSMEATGKTGWIKAKRFGDWCENNPQVIAIDCEMCETEDPVTKKKQPNALCRISIVDAVTDEILLNSLVKPKWPVTDYRTFINGINEESLKDVQFTIEHAQAFMQALCSEETVVVGHAVHHDMKALQMEHYCCADSSMLFRAQDSETATVSLKDCAFSILNKDMPKTHDSVNDARAALRCVEHYLEKKGKVKPIVRRQVETRNALASQLFVHRIPKIVTTDHLASMFLESTKVATTKVDEVAPVGDGSMGKTYVHFLTASHANLAFETLTGKPEQDSSGKLQKKVYLRGGQYIRIRKNLAERPRKDPESTNSINRSNNKA